jgi:hypothetical protein
MGSLKSIAGLAAQGFTKAAALSMFAASGLILANPGAAHAALCPGSQSLGLFSLAFNCQTPSGFDFTLTSFPGFSTADTLSINSTSSSFTIGVLSNANWAPGSYTLNYSLTAPPAKILSNYSSSLTSSVNPIDAGTWDVNGANGIAGATFSGGLGINGNKTYIPKISSDTFTSTLTVTKGVIQSVTSSVNVVDAPRSKVPGPLPLLGAGAAFGFSRRLRQRVKLAV